MISTEKKTDMENDGVEVKWGEDELQQGEYDVEQSAHGDHTELVK